MSTTQSLPFIENGSVIDHIPDGRAWRMVEILGLETHPFRVSIGLHLPSSSMGKKDMVKIEGWHITAAQANTIAVLAPDATITHITDYVIEQKFQVCLPDVMENVIVCPNLECITNHDPCSTKFYTHVMRGGTLLQCHHCQTLFKQDEITTSTVT